MKNSNSKPSRDYFTLEDELDTVFCIDRIALIELNEEDPPCPVFETVGEIIEFYRRLAARRIAARNSLAGKSNDQAIDEEVRHLQREIATLLNRMPEMIDPEERFGNIVPLRDQRKAWKEIFAGFPGLLSWSGTFSANLFFFLFLAIFLIIPAVGGIANAWFPEMVRVNVFFGIALCGLFALFLIIILQICYFRHRWQYHALSLREIARKIVDAKKQYADYPIASTGEIEPLFLKTLSETFDIPLDSLKPETRADTELGFEL